MNKTKYTRIELINNILNFNISCTICGFKYTYEYLNELSTLKLLNILTDPTSKILKHDSNCIKKYKHLQTIKYCEKCDAEISKTRKSNICKDCEHKERLTRICKHCGTSIILKNGHTSFEYCDDCWSKDIKFEIQSNEFFNADSIVRKCISDSYITLSELFFNKLFNKNNKQTFNKDTVEYHKLKSEKTNDICNFINNFTNHLVNAYIKYKWNSETISNLISCLTNILFCESGSVITSKRITVEYDKVLPTWKDLLNEQFNNVITCLYEFTFSACEGKGEFFWLLINKDVQCNYLSQADALYYNNTLGEIKCAENKAKAGRLLFKRDSWFGTTDFETWKSLFNNDLQVWQLTNPVIANNGKLTNLIKEINTREPDNFTWNNKNGFFYDCSNELKLIDRSLANMFIKYIFNITINHNKSFKPRFLELDLTDNKNFKLFHFVNYCLYYMLEDAKSENLDKLIFMSNNKSLVLSKKMLETYTKDKLNKLIENVEIAYPENGFTKSKYESHDRNKNRAPGIYFKGENK